MAGVDAEWGEGAGKVRETGGRERILPMPAKLGYCVRLMVVWDFELMGGCEATSGIEIRSTSNSLQPNWEEKLGFFGWKDWSDGTRKDWERWRWMGWQQENDSQIHIGDEFF